MTGNIVNVITKSGRNEFHGDVLRYLDNNGLQDTAKPVVSSETSVGSTRMDFGAGLGGSVLKDRLWFFGAYDRVSNSLDSALPEVPRQGEIVTSKSTRDLATAKPTGKLDGGHTLIATFFQNPRDDTGAIDDASPAPGGGTGRSPAPLGYSKYPLTSMRMWAKPQG